MANEMKNHIMARLDERIASVKRKRYSLGKNLRVAKFLRILFGISSISLVSLSAFSEFSDNVRFFFTLSALATTTIATFSDEVLAAFGFSERYAQNIGTLGQLRNLKAEMELELASLDDALPDKPIDYWEYHRRLNNILNSSHSNWNTSLSRSRK